MNTWAFWSTLHYFWLVFQEQPLVVYLEGPSLYGAGIPFAVSLLVLLWVFARDVLKIHNKTRNTLILNLYAYTPKTSEIPLKLLLGFFLANIAIGHYSGYWTDLGYHFLDTSVIFWPVLVLLDKRIPTLLVYPLTFFGMLADDVFAAGQYGHWAGNYWFGVGGAGFNDGLFVGPLTALSLSVLMFFVRYVMGKYDIHFNGALDLNSEL